MALECPECHTANDDRLGICVACGCRLSPEMHQRRWENAIIPYLAIAVAIGLMVAAMIFFRVFK
jgi:hypothetical protein